MDIRGTVVMRYMHEGSKSEGWKALLMAEDLTVYQLYQPDVFPINNDFFYPFDRKDVVVTGTIVDGTFLSVDHIELINTDESINNEQNDEEDLPSMQ